MSEPTTIVVGFSIEEEEYDSYKDLPTRYGRGKFHLYTAGYEYHDEGPTLIVGAEIAATWNDAIKLEDLQRKIADAKTAVEEKFSKSASTWLIGHQT